MKGQIDSVRINFDNDSLWLLNICLAIIMYGVALDIKISDFKRLYSMPKPALIGIISQFILLPALTFLLVVIIKPIPSIALGMILVAACPGGNISNFMSHLAKGNTALSVTLTAFATLVAIFMTPLNLSIWGSLYAPTNEILKEVSLDPMKLFETIAMILGIPLIMGMVTQKIAPILAEKMQKILKPLSMLIFIAFVVIAFSNNLDIFLDYFQYIVWIVLFHNAIAFLSGFTLSRVAKLDIRDTRSITIETGIQNSGLGLLLIFAFFDGLGGMAITAAWWGIWHIVSGMTLGFLWSKKPVLLAEEA